MARTKYQTAKDSAANLGFEATLWLASDKLRNNMDAAEYKHVVLGLVSLMRISDKFKEHRAKLAEGIGAPAAKLDDISIHGEESSYTTLRLARMNLAIRSVEANLGSRSRLTPDSRTLSADAKESESPRWR